MKTLSRHDTDCRWRAIPRFAGLSGHTPKRELRHRAFTLIEIMVAMAVLALVLAAIYSTWALILRGSKSGLEAAAEAQRERVAVRIIEETLGSVRSFAADLQHYSFVVENGAEATLSFGARLPKAFPRSGRFGDFDVRRVMFSVENGPEGERDLVLRQWPILMEMDDDERDHPLVLARNVTDFIVETWDAQKKDWADTWEQTNQIPTLVKVTLSIATPGRIGSFSQPVEQTSRVMALSSITVPATWQTPSGQRGGGGQGGQRNRGGQNQNNQGGQGGQGGIRLPQVVRPQ